MSSYLEITGGKPLELDKATFDLPGFKHAWVVTLCSTVLFPSIEFHFSNVPQIAETKILTQILLHLGANCDWDQDKVTISTGNLVSKPIPSELSEQIHGALYLFPVLLARFGEAELGCSGGCAIGSTNNLGSRPYDHMITILEKFGYEVSCPNANLVGKRTNHSSTEITIDIRDFTDRENQLTGPKISGATKTALLLAASLASNSHVKILHPYLKPDVLELLRFLQLLPFEISWNKTEILIRKKEEAEAKECRFTLLGDVSVLMTYITLAVIFKQSVFIKNVRINDLLSGIANECALLEKMGITLTREDNAVRIIPPHTIKAVDIDVFSTSIYSDHQPFFALMLTQAKTSSKITEFVWLNRFDYAKELRKLGYEFQLDCNQLAVIPSRPIHSQALLDAKDLRSAAVLLLAACHAIGKFTLTGHEHLIRGYENLIEQLNHMGAHIREIYAA